MRLRLRLIAFIIPFFSHCSFFLSFFLSFRISHVNTENFVSQFSKKLLKLETFNQVCIRTMVDCNVGFTILNLTKE